MATTFFTKAPDTVQAPWNSTMGTISAALTTLGLTKTTDTGQVDWTTLQAVPAASTWTLYEIRQFTDALQATSPFYMRIEYGQIASQWAMRITVGTSTDGAGNLTGALSSQFIISSNINVATGTCYMSSDGSRLQMTMWPNLAGTNQGTCISISRSVDSTGVYTGDGVNIVGFGSGKFQQWMPRGSLGTRFPATAAVNFMCGAPATLTGNAGTDIGVFPVYPMKGYADYFDMGAMVVAPVDVAVGTVFTVLLYGATHTYIVGGNNATNHPSANGNTNFSGLAMRYE